MRSTAARRDTPSKAKAAMAGLADRRTIGMLVLAVLILCATIGLNVYLRTSLRQSVTLSEQKTVQRVVRTYAQHFEQTFVSIDSTLRAIAARVVLREDSTRELHQVLRQTADALRVVRSFSVTDEKGRITVSSRSDPPPRVDLAGRDYIAYYIDGGTEARFIAAPGQNLVDGQWQLSISVPVRARDGTLIGVVSAAIDPRSIMSPMSGALEDGDDLALLTPELIVAARLPWSDEAIGKPSAQGVSLSGEPSSRVADDTSQSVGVYAEPGSRQHRIGVTQRVVDGRFLLSSSRNLDQALASWRLLEDIALLASILLFLMVVALMALGDRRIRQEMAQRRRLAELNTRLKVESDEVSRLANVKSEFLANMSHEIRTPMNAILGLTQLLKRTRLSPEQDNHVKRITASGRFLLSVIDDILTFTKIESDALEIEQTPFRLEDVLTALATMMSGSGAGKNIESLIHLDPDVPPMLSGDPLRLQQVLFNLASNAIKFTESGHVTVRVSLVQGGSPEAGVPVTLRFSVTDSGLGIDADKIALLFSPFSQADSSTTRRFGGTGLGLAICKRLTKLMGGDLGVSSQLGVGSEFWFTVPFTTARKDSAARMPPDMRSLKVLVVDDNSAARDAICTAVHALSWQFDEAESGALALSRLRSRALEGRSPDVVLVDLEMPGMDGIDMAELLKHEAFLAPPMCVLMTNGQSKDMPDDLIDSVLIKPVTSSTLFDAVLQAKAHRSGHGRLDADAAPDAGSRQLRGVRILLVEDNSINQDIARHLLAHEGALVTVADNGRAAVDQLAATPDAFDVVLMDVQMPVLDGIEASLEIRHRLGLKELPIIAQTAGALAPDRDRCRAAGMNGFISKPFDADKLPQQILAHVKHRPDGSAPSSGSLLRLRDGEAACEGKAPGSQPLSQPLFSIEGIDVAEAMRLLGGNESLLRALLQLLESQFGRIDVDVREALAKGNVPAALANLHKLRGGSAQVGARGLHEAAVRLETALNGHGHSSDWSGPLEQLSREVAKVIPAVRRSLASSQLVG